MISKEKRKSLLHAFVALLFSIVLYYNANGQTMQNTLSGNESYTQTVSDVSVQLLYDTDKYYIHGYENTVTAKLSSANRVQLNAEANEDTRMFRVTADLVGLSEGTHEVPLKVRNLSSAVKAELSPETITVTIEKKVTKDFDVSPVLPSEATPAGYPLNEPVVSPEEVSITTGDKTMAEIKKIVATVDPSTITNDGIDAKVAVQAYNATGEALSIISDPVQVTVRADVTKPTRSIRLYGTQQGTPGRGVASYEFRFSDIEAEVTGPENQLELLGDSLTIPIDISGIVHRTTRKIDIPVENGLTVSPSSIEVEITPVMEQKEESTSDSKSETSVTSRSSSSTTTAADTVPSASSNEEQTSQPSSSEETKETTSESTEATSESTNQGNSSEN
ncbi:hypothetical protein A5844_000451 [Enterococcus sp. 10A9_DIV0425]|uniref:YbbR-like protein n=1 Tax=Candidatus Enterococcus wittei TaxID=1987383 RepID=A0A2C9XPY0_9ENTE|nr:CdaR family protein [Enterococcus sp. 10A9_DIV0425]OTP12219.1 hypothetical protein A5844_000451 [Enterococcus sp. 10A9_DIV0425]THE13352.1 hypothetical protein E1H99_06100 [Enterococcus hirae]